MTVAPGREDVAAKAPSFGATTARHPVHLDRASSASARRASSADDVLTTNVAEYVFGEPS